MMSAGADVMSTDARIPVPMRGYLAELVARLEAVLGDGLLGVYLFGSAALDDWVEGISDVDVAAVAADGSLTPRRLDAIGERLDEKALPVAARKLEFVLYTASAASSGNPRFSLNFNTGPQDPTTIDLDPTRVPVFWFVLDVAIGRERAIILRGPPPARLFHAPSDEAVREALAEGLRWQRSNPEPASAVLAACRTWRYLEEGQWHGKGAAGGWAIDKLRDADPEAGQLVSAIVAAREQGGAAAPADEVVAARIVDRVSQALGV
jgi:predicted nucleotidyltransferase